MGRLFPTKKQVTFAQSLGIEVASQITASQLSKLINSALDEQKRIDDERVQQANDTDMLELANKYTMMSRQSWRYHCGPCPICKKALEDGFVVNTDHNSWFCRKCDDKGTPIGFLMKKENLSFWEAVTELVGESYVRLVPTKRLAPREKKKAVFLWGKDKWQREAQHMVSMSSQRLTNVGGDLAQHYGNHSQTMSMVTLGSQARAHHCDSDAARNYLTHERAISMTAARAWRLGQARVRFKVKKGKKGSKEEANAIIIPWMGPDGLIKAIQYRLIGGASRRFHSKYGGEKTIYGAHLLAPSRDKLLIIVEGEFNAISIWQEAHQMDLPIDVISIGGEGISDERLSSLVKLVARYRGGIAWLDRAKVAKKVGRFLEGVMLLSSPGGHDANRLAQSGELAGIIEVICSEEVPQLGITTVPKHGASVDDAAGPQDDELTASEELLMACGVIRDEVGCDKAHRLYLQAEDLYMSAPLCDLFAHYEKMVELTKQLHQTSFDLSDVGVKQEKREYYF